MTDIDYVVKRYGLGLSRDLAAVLAAIHGKFEDDVTPTVTADVLGQVKLAKRTVKDYRAEDEVNSYRHEVEL